MYLGHVGVALGAKGARRDIGLLVLLIATYAPDWIDSGLCLAGAYDPRGMLSHSLPAVAVLSAIVLSTYRVKRGDMISGLIVAGVVISHMVLDWITGSKPTWPGGPMIGLRLYAHPIADLFLESAVIIVGVFLYRRSLSARSRPWIDVAAMVGALVVMQAVITIARALTVSLPKC
ncbi:MAG: metal-dependent hydrolase [Gemmatimonadaceae bacterium]